MADSPKKGIYHIKITTFSHLSGVLIFYKIVVFYKNKHDGIYYYIVLSRQRAPANSFASIYSSSVWFIPWVVFELLLCWFLTRLLFFIKTGPEKSGGGGTLAWRLGCCCVMEKQALALRLQSSRTFQFKANASGSWLMAKAMERPSVLRTRPGPWF